MFNATEAAARWARVRQMMSHHDLDMVLAIDCSPDEILHGNQRWLTGFIARGGPAAVLLHCDGYIELISQRAGKTLNDYFESVEIPLEMVSGFSPKLVAERVSRLRPKRLGIADPEYFSAAIASALSELSTPPEVVDASEAFNKLRLQKSPYEISLIRKSCAIADAVWERVPELFKIGRKNYEIVADVDHLVRLDGAEGGFHLLMELPFEGMPLPLLVRDDVIHADSRYLLEISPYYDGYYSQLTIPVTTRVNDETILRAHQDIVEAKHAAGPKMHPGADLSEVAKFVESFLAERGHTMTSLSLGHFCGMALTEPRHDPRSPFILEEGMTLIFHPILADAGLSAIQRADTYLITQSGAERLNRYKNEMLTVR
jgi:Xaa-Pro aminopeptidase